MTAFPYFVRQMKVLGVKLACVFWLAVVYRFAWHHDVVAWAMVAVVLICNAKFLQNMWIEQRRRSNDGGGR